MKQYVFSFLLLLIFFGCTKEEGLPGPEGEPGQTGPPGAPGSGTGGNLEIISYITPPGTAFNWVRERANFNSATYRLNWMPPGQTRPSARFVFDDQLNNAVANREFIVYIAKAPYDGAVAEREWHQLPYTPAEFYGFNSFRYELRQSGNRYYIQVAAEVYGDPNWSQAPVSNFNCLRIVVLPPRTGIDNPLF